MVLCILVTIKLFGRNEQRPPAYPFSKEELAKIPLTRIERLLVGYKKCSKAVILAKGGVANFCFGPLFVFCYFEIIKDGNKKEILLNI